MSLMNGLNAAAKGLSDTLDLGIKSFLEQDKIKLADSLAGAREEKGDYRRQEIARTTAEEGLGRDVRRVGLIGDATEAQAVKDAPAQNERALVKMRGEGAAKIELELDAFKKLAPAKRQEAIDTEVAKVTAMATPEMLAASRKIAMSKHIVDPSYTAVPNEDGTVTMVNSRNPKDAKTLEVDGVPVIQKNPEQRLAAVAVINMVAKDKHEAMLRYKADTAAAMGDANATAAAKREWDAAEKLAESRVAPALAVLYGKAGMEPSSPAKAADKPADRLENGRVFKNNVDIGPAASVEEARRMLKAPTPQPKADGFMNSAPKAAPSAPAPNTSGGNTSELFAQDVATGRALKSAQATVQQQLRELGPNDSTKRTELLAAFAQQAAVLQPLEAKLKDNGISL